MEDEEFFLGDGFDDDSDDFFLGDKGEEKKDDEEFFLGDAKSENDSDNENGFLGGKKEKNDVDNQNITTKSDVKIQQPKKNDSDFNGEKDELAEIQKIYEILQINEKPVQVEFEEYLKSNSEIFKILGTGYFKVPTKEQFQTFEKNSKKWISIAHKNWSEIENQRKLEDLENALGTLISIFKYEAKAESYVKEIKKRAQEPLQAVLHQKIKDGILSIDEIQEIIEIAVSRHLVQDNKKVIPWLTKLACEEFKFSQFAIEPFEESFAHFVASKPELSRLDTKRCENELFLEYKRLFRINAQVYGEEKHEDENELFKNMLDLLISQKLLVSHLDFFVSDFFEPEKQNKKDRYNFSLPLDNEYFYFLKGTALNIYDFSPSEWENFANKENLRPVSDSTVAFIMGKNKASISEIPDLLEKNPEMAAERILAGDLETYFSHLGNYDYAKKIENLKFDFGKDKSELVSSVVNFLRGNLKNQAKLPEENQKSNSDLIENLIEEKASLKKIVSFVVKNKNDESLINEILSEDFEQNLKSNYTKFLLNLLNELLKEIDIAQYKFAFVKVAEKVQQILTEKQDFITFACVFSFFVKRAKQKNVVLSFSEITGFEDTNEIMQKEFEK